MIGDLAEKIGWKAPLWRSESGMHVCILQRISAAAYVTAFPEYVAFEEMLQCMMQRRFFLLLQHMADCHRTLFADASCRVM